MTTTMRTTTTTVVAAKTVKVAAEKVPDGDWKEVKRG